MDKLITGLTCFSVGLSLVTIFGHLKNYRVVTIQRLVVRILLIVPLYSISAASIYFSWRCSSLLIAARELYEAFVIYTFYTLLTAVLGGEREIILTAAGRAPKTPIWPFSLVVGPTDISNPPTFLLIKQCLFQYVWIQTALVFCGFIFSKHVIWLLRIVIYNVSLTVALNALSLFWFCLYYDLKPSNMFLKFACVKLIVFFSNWQTLGLTLAHKAGFVHDVKHISSTLLAVEMALFAALHAFAFSYKDFAGDKMLRCGRLPLNYAIRDVFGAKDIFIDLKRTFIGPRYGYHDFESVEAVMDHPASLSRQGRMRAGLRFSSNGQRRYWLPLQRSNLASTPELSYGTSLGPSSSVEQPRQIAWDERELEEDDELYEAVRNTYGDPNFPVIENAVPERYVTMAERFANVSSSDDDSNV